MYLHISHILKLQNGISVLKVSAGFKITLCGHNLNYGKTKQTRNETFSKVNKKGEKKNSKKKKARVWPRKAYFCENGSYNFEKDTKLRRENERYN